MAAPLAVQLYTVRDLLAQDFEGVIRRIAEIGYAGVEPAGFAGTTAQAAADLFDSLDLQVPSAHMSLPLGDKQNEVLETMAALGCKYLVVPWLDPKQYYSTLDQIKAATDLLNQANAIAHDHGLTLAYHNHWFEYQQVEGQYPYKVMLERLDPGIVFEVDAYWVKTAGLDPVTVLKELGARAPLLHVKDGPATLDDPMLAVGEGKLDYGTIIPAAADKTEWLIVELDRCATDMLEAVQKSYTYLTGKGLAHGK